MFLALALACSDYGFGSRLEPGSFDSGAPPASNASTGPTSPTVTPTDPGPDPGLRGGHFDVDTTSFIAQVTVGTTEGHVHEYDDIFDVAGVDLLDPRHDELQPLAEAVEDPDLPFVLVVANPDLSPGARLTLDGPYDPDDPSTWITAPVYADIPLDDLERYTLRTLPALGVFFAPDAIATGGLVGSETACVRNNVLGPEGEWRNGALTVQAIRADQLQTDLSLSAGGVHGVATAGLLWEAVVFWHWFERCR